MFSVSITFAAQNWRLLYKTEERANEAFTLATQKTTHDFNPGESFELIDDFGQRAWFIRPVSGVMLENLDQSKLGNIEYGLHGARVQHEFQKRAQADPVIRAGISAGGPAIINPVGNRQWRS